MLTFNHVVTGLGAVSLLSLIYRATRFIIIHGSPSRLLRYRHNSKDGRPPWALVTGASDGIGKAISRELSASKFNVVLHGRNKDKLQGVLDELQRDFPEREFRLLIADASLVGCRACIESDDPGSLDFPKIADQLADLHLTVLINNAGGNGLRPSFLCLAEHSYERLANIVSLNGLFAFYLTRALLPQLSANGPALVLSISSLSDKGFPLLAPYSAAKAMLLSWSKSARLEFSMKGSEADVEVLAVRAGKVTGVSIFQQDSSLFVPNATTFAKSCLAKAGKNNGLVLGYWLHEIQESLLYFVPTWMEEYIMKTALQHEKDEADRIKSD